MQKITLLIASAFLLSLLAVSSIAADPQARSVPAHPKTTTVYILFRGGNASLQYQIESGTLLNIEKDLLTHLGDLGYTFRQYTFSSQGRDSSITINLREVLSVTIQN